jgi:hypothetical protein
MFWNVASQTHDNSAQGNPDQNNPDQSKPVKKSDKRHNARQPISGKLRILWEGADGQSQVHVAELENISSRGMKIRTDVQMAPRTYVMVNDREIGVMGRGSVRYCRYEKGKYSVGLEFSGGTGWDPEAPPRSSPRWQ